MKAALIDMEYTQGITSSLGNFGVAILAELAKLRLNLLVANISQNNENRGQVFPSLERLFKERHRAFACFD